MFESYKCISEHKVYKAAFRWWIWKVLICTYMCCHSVMDGSV